MKVVKTLYKMESINATMSSKVGEVFQAAMNNNAEEIKSIVRKKIDKCERQGRTPLMVAALHGQHKALEVLLAFGAQADVVDDYGNTAMHDCYSAPVQTVQLLLDYGSNVNVRNQQGETPLHLAAYECNLEVVELLLKHGADTSVRNFENQMPHQKLEGLNRSNNYNTVTAGKIITLLEGWDTKTSKKKPPPIKGVKEEMMEGLIKVQDDVTGMTKDMTVLIEKIEKLTEHVITTSKQLVDSEQRAGKFEHVLNDILKEVKIQPEFITNSAIAGKKLSKLLNMTSHMYENLCHTNDFNNRVFSRIFFEIAEVIGRQPDLWKKLAERLCDGYPNTYVNDLINTITASHTDDVKRTYECLLQWKVFNGTYVDKVEPLKKIITAMALPESHALCTSIDNIMDVFDEQMQETPTGSLSEKGLHDLAKNLGNKWMEVGIQLDIATTELENLSNTFPFLETRNFQMLLKWVQREEGFNRIKLARLAEALKRAGRVDLAKTLKL